ncbi:enoyl-CoA hydratase/isomerase family protein [Novosphingobium album (ex Liu et al. 2023)]|uniref:Enoyl-CoA hydratase/isomerase family protein n=1 Tax=Novosphingobium album (ex Liu et al. 2023) TaxID=3031130 RepID=A0ABT5WTS1_9SPHN|nr:enoyl-CoA hydratase/isomerase family protein [Novosphingobium album (ex Liu et al. 2023)]MDE8653284.1 enoyl-CoA hydratase/isomerase family protein [Novosphingobium album (ex Liu et al. 2023)]
MAEADRPQPEEIVLYHKDPKTKIATITLNRPDALNAPTIAARLRFADLVHRANIDDDVKVLVIRGEGKHLGSGADLPEQSDMLNPDSDISLLKEFRIDDDGSVTYPPAGSYRFLAGITNLYANADFGCRSLQNFKKISILECKGYVYGWHFYLAGDADIVVASEEALFGHAAFRYVGWGPRMWTWAEMMGPRKFAEMLFTGRPFTAREMYDCNFVNSVVPRERLEEETAKYAHACSITRPNDTVAVQKTFMELYKQYRGEYFGSLLTGFVEGVKPIMTDDTAEDLGLGGDTFEQGLNNAVKDNDMRFPADWRLSYGGRKKP